MIETREALAKLIELMRAEQERTMGGTSEESDYEYALYNLKNELETD